MADNLTLPVATNEISGFHYQKVKLMDGTAGSTTPAVIDATYGLAVDVKRTAGQYLEDSAHASGDIGFMPLAVRVDSAASLVSANGDYSPLQVDSTGALLVTSSGGGGGGGAVEGTVAHSGVDADNPVKVGFKAENQLSGATLVSDGDVTDGYADLDGVQIVRLNAPHGDSVSGNASDTSGSSTSCIAAQGTGIKTVLTDITLVNSSSTSVTVDIKDGTTVKWTFPVPAGGGVVFSWNRPLVGTANTAWNFDSSAAVSTLYCSMSGYISKV